MSRDVFRRTNDDIYVAKSQHPAQEPMFGLSPNRSCVVHDDNVDIRRSYENEAIGSVYNNMIPFEQIRDKPIREEDTLNYVYEKPREELHAIGSLPDVYENIGVGTPGQGLSKPTMISQVGVYAPPKTFERKNPDEGTGASSAYEFAAPMYGAVRADTTNRQCTGNTSYLSPADNQGPERTSPDDRNNVVNKTPMNDLSICGPRLGGATPLANAMVSKLNDVSRRTRKEWNILHPRQFGRFHSNIPDKMALASDDLPQTTIKETLIHDTVEAVITGPTADRMRSDDSARKTLRESLPVDYDARNFASGKKQVTVIDIDALRKVLGVTHRETISETDYIGIYSGMTKSGHEKNLKYIRIPTTSKDVSQDVFRIDAAKATTQFYKGLGDLANWVIDPLRNILEKVRPMAREGVKTAVGAEDINVRVPIDCKEAPRAYGNARGHDGVRIKGDGGVSSNKNPGWSDRLSVETEGALSQYARNPYAVKPIFMS